MKGKTQKKTNSQISDANYRILNLFADDRERKQTGIQSIFFEVSMQVAFNLCSADFSCIFRFISKLISLICLIHAPSSQTVKSAVEYRATQSQFFIFLIPFFCSRTFFSLLLRIPFSLMQFSQPHSALHSEHKYG